MGNDLKGMSVHLVVRRKPVSRRGSDRVLKQAIRSAWRRALLFLGEWLEDLSQQESKSEQTRRIAKHQPQREASVDRQIAPEEAAVIRWLLDNSYIPDVSAYTGISTESLRVVVECTCGCRSINFSTNTAGASIISDALAVYSDGLEAELILWGRDDQVIALEVIDHAEGTSGRLPQLSDLRTWEARGRELAGGGSA